MRERARETQKIKWSNPILCSGVLHMNLGMLPILTTISSPSPHLPPFFSCHVAVRFQIHSLLKNCQIP